MAFCRDFSFALFLSRQAVTAQMRDERERELCGQRERERLRETLRNVAGRERQRA